MNHGRNQYVNMTKVVAIVQARMGSSRLPGKPLKMILGKPALELLLERLSLAKNINQIVVATSKNSEDDAIEDLCGKLGYICFRGSSDNVLKRTSQASDSVDAEIIANITGDCILTCSEVVDEAVEYFLKHDIDYLSNLMKQTYPQGVDIRVFRAKDLREICNIVAKQNDVSCQEHVYLYFEENPQDFRIHIMKAPHEFFRPEWRLDLDYEEDLKLLNIIFEDLYTRNPFFGLKELVNWLDTHPQYRSINQNMFRKPVRP